MELELDFGKGSSYWREVLVAVILVTLIALGVLGWSISKNDANGQAQILTWTDYQVSKAEKVYLAELEILRADTEALAQLLAQSPEPSPAAVQIKVNQILADASSGTPELTEARAALANAAGLVRDWSIGSVEKDQAILSIQTLTQLLAG
jgi:hypothetical protein